MAWRKGSVRRKIYRRIPRWIKKHDFELFAVILCFISGLPLLLGQITPKSLESQLPSIIVLIWALTLVVGPICVFIGIYKAYTQNLPLPDVVMWMRTEAFGMSLLGWASFIYAVCILLNDAVTGWVAAMITFIFSLTCASREAGIQEDIDKRKDEVGVIRNGNS